jgi:hypothetical protein
MEGTDSVAAGRLRSSGIDKPVHFRFPAESGSRATYSTDRNNLGVPGTEGLPLSQAAGKAKTLAKRLPRRTTPCQTLSFGQRPGMPSSPSAATPAYNMCLNSCMNFKSLLRVGPTILFCATLSTALIAHAASPDATPAASTTTKHKVSLDTVKATRLSRLKNQVGLTADQEAKAKPIIDKYVDDRHATNHEGAKLVALKAKYDSDINAILTPDQQQKLAAAKAATAEKLKAARAAKAAAAASSSPAPAKSN